ncbi:putative late blight resistance protein homolog R1A-3 [Primulina eburnea]|uniref:putative late blight resistance protein homolog R1A-3 n=1 Tax=Primulina eburnea TaxID=1245227 RepID=UPI003C6C4D23
MSCLQPVLTNLHLCRLHQDVHWLAKNPWWESTEDLIQIKDRVVGDEQNLQIIPIIGMGGIGKTTLARNVYEDQLTIDYFDIRHWLTVSQEYSVRDILGRILSVEEPIDEKVELLIERVYKSLKGRKYLVVMDDMWHAEVWYKVRRAFPDDYIGSRVILTTRLSDVASTIDSNSPLHKMRLLDEDRSWALFCKKAFAAECPPSHDMKEIGKSIARNCKGLPLAIIVITGLLKANKTREHWENVAENLNVASTVNDDQFSEPVEPKSLEELAEEYLEDLVKRSLVLVVGTRSNGGMKSCRIHDVLRDLSIKKGREERFLQHFTNKDNKKSILLKIAEGPRRLSICADYVNFELTDIHNSSIHTLLCFGSESYLLSSIASQFKSLRVVDEVLLDPEDFPDEIFELVNLRYLAFILFQSSKCEIPPSISKLQHLQTLIIKRDIMSIGHSGKVILPLEIWKMIQLRHLVFTKETAFCFPPGDGLGGTYSVLENLQTFSGVLNFKFTKEAIGGFPNLKKLKLEYDCNEPGEGWAKFCLGNLVHLQELEVLNLQLYGLGFGSVDTSFAFPQRLRKLTLTGCKIPWEKMSIIGCLPNLEVLKLLLGSFAGKEWETTEGEFLVLKYLQIRNIDLMEWRVESSTHFPCLETLILWCYKLKEVPSSVGDIPTLQNLRVQVSHMKAKDSVSQIIEEQENLGNDALQVRIMPLVLKTGPEATHKRPLAQAQPGAGIQKKPR